MSDEKRIVKPISMNRIRKLKALCRKATPAPWKDIRHSIQSEDGYEIGRTYRVESQKDMICHLDSYLGYSENERADAAFIATARQAAPDLLAEIERLKDEKQQLEKENIQLAEFLSDIDGAFSERCPCPANLEWLDFECPHEREKKAFGCNDYEVDCWRMAARKAISEG